MQTFSYDLPFFGAAQITRVHWGLVHVLVDLGFSGLGVLGFRKEGRKEGRNGGRKEGRKGGREGGMKGGIP